MKITGNSDSHFVIGKKHITQNAPCQDHALSGRVGEILFAVVSDGCSSGRHTDIGARIITCATITAIKDCLLITDDLAQLPQLIHQTLANHAIKTAICMGLENEDLLATCVYAVVTPKGGFIHVLGDGHAVIKFTNGDIKLVNTDWEPNAPYYPADNRKLGFIAHHKNSPMSLRVETVFGSVGAPATTEELISVESGMSGYVISLSEEELGGVEVIAIMSDGVGRFKKDGSFLKPLDVITQFTAFKNWVGEFVKRRLSRGLLDFGREATLPDDDVAVAAIHLEHKTQE
jgi:hypothetical protein